MGWISDWEDEFGGYNANLADRPGWNDWRTTLYIPPTVVDGGKAEIRNVEAPSQYSDRRSVAGGVTDTARVPQFGPGAGGYRHKWCAVVDFYGKARYVPTYGHIAVFIRVHDRTWGGTPDQTRFGCFVRGDTSMTEGLTNSPLVPQAAIEFVGDKIEGSGGQQWVQRFALDEDPFDNPNTKYQVKIIEEEWNSPITGWTPQWTAEVWNLDDETRIGHLGPYTKYSLRLQNIETPPLSGSKIAMGSGPATAGSIDATRCANAKWQYDAIEPAAILL